MDNPLHKKNTSTSKDFFLWLGVTITLYLSSVSLVMLLFEYIKILFPNPLDTYFDPYRGAIRFAIASLIVAFPLYIYLTRVVNTDIRKHREKSDIAVRKWILSLTLFVAALTLLIDLIVLINTFLGGEITAQFILQVITVLVVIGGVFLYYLYDLRGFWREHESRSKLMGLIAALAILISVVGGFFIMGSPTSQRLLHLDERKVNDLQSIQWEVLNYYQSKGEVPDALPEIENAFSYFSLPADPQTGEFYKYEKTGKLSFTLCATFNKPSPASTITDPRLSPGLKGSENWQHDPGEVCFERDIDPELYPVRDSTP